MPPQRKEFFSKRDTSTPHNTTRWSMPCIGIGLLASPEDPPPVDRTLFFPQSQAYSHSVPQLCPPIKGDCPSDHKWMFARSHATCGTQVSSPPLRRIARPRSTDGCTANITSSTQCNHLPVSATRAPIKGMARERTDRWRVATCISPFSVVFLEGETQEPATEPRAAQHAGICSNPQQRVASNSCLRGLNAAYSLRFLLLLAGIERNPGPPKTCNGCNSQMKNANHLKCSKRCLNVCHKQAWCSGISRSCTEQNTWTCSTHDPLYANYLANRPSRSVSGVPNKQCPKPNCGKNLKSNPVVCNGCNQGFHQLCSGLNRYELVRRRPTWKCPPCKDGVTPTTATTEQPADEQTNQPHPNDLTGHPCIKCKNRLVPGYLNCKTCKKGCHQKKECSGLNTRGACEKAAKGNFWECHFCTVKNRPPDNPPKDSNDISEKSEPRRKSKLKRPLRILQWNAEGVNTKMDELQCFLQDYNIDIAMIQESKFMEEKSRSPVIKGYSLVRADRKGAKFTGGGLLTFIGTDIDFKPYGHSQRDAVELLSVGIQQSKNKWLTLNNFYIPDGTMDLSWIPTEENTIYARDFNGHSQLWDNIQPEDTRGGEILDWMLDNDLTCLNDGSPTRVNRGTGGLSTPDITFISRNLSTKVKWHVVEDTDMGSDHSPIVIEVSDAVPQTITSTPLRTRWSRKKADWAAYREEVENNLHNVSDSSMTNMVRSFTNIMIEAGKKHVGKTKPTKSKFAMNPKVKALVKKRNRLRKEVSTKRVEWIQAARDVREAREEAKVEAWSEFVETLETDPDSGKVWRVIRSLDGIPDGAAPNEALCHKGKTITSNKSKGQKQIRSQNIMQK